MILTALRQIRDDVECLVVAVLGVIVFVCCTSCRGRSDNSAGQADEAGESFHFVYKIT